MPKSGFTGISFPFRISPQGGVVMSTTGKGNPQHIMEGIKQLLQTDFLERPMEPDFGSNLGSTLFEPNNETLKTVIKKRIIEAVENFDERVIVTEDDIEFFTEEEDELRGYLYAEVNFYIVQYETYYEEILKVGELNG